MNDLQRISKVIAVCPSPVIKKQIGYLLGTYQLNLQELKIDVEEQPDLMTATNDWLPRMYKFLAKVSGYFETHIPIT